MYKSKSDLEKVLALSESEKAWSEDIPHLPVLISDEVMALIDKYDQNDPIRRQFVPSKEEQSDYLGSLDPLEEVKHSKSERFIHRYENRAALLVTDQCFAYCRHCFRRRFTGHEIGAVTRHELEEICKYLEKHTEIEEILLTGGDLFVLSDRKLEEVIGMLKETRPDIILRLCTRALLSHPKRFTDELFRVFERHNTGAPYYLMTQFNHPREITKESVEIVSRFLSLGIIAFNQSVLLKGVNDSVEVQVELARKLLVNRIKPYYLFQGDLVNGTSHLRVDIKKGLEMEKEMRKRLSGLEMPMYTIDLPEGGGKAILTHNYLAGEDENSWIFDSPYGGKREYPKIN